MNFLYSNRFKLSVFALTLATTLLTLPRAPEATAESQKSAPQPLVFDPNIFVALAKKTVPGVVNISTLSKPRAMAMNRGLPDEFFGQLFPQFPQPRPESKDIARPHSLGTGFIIDTNGTVLTNNHVIDGADEIQIQFTENPNEKPTVAKIIGRDPSLDIALLKVALPKNGVALPLGDSDALEVGEYVMAVGNPFGQGHSVAHGLISAKGRISPELPLTQYLQTDTPINPGNSGGPLVNLKGEVIGINNAIDARAQGIGFAIPISAVKKVLSQLKEDGKVSRGYLGLLVETIRPEMAKNLGISEKIEGVIVSQAEPGAPAFRAGIRPYDVITQVEEKAILSPSDLINTVAGLPAGKSVKVKINREGKKLELSVKLAQRPDQNLVR